MPEIQTARFNLKIQIAMSDLRNRGEALPHCCCGSALLESEQGLLRLIPHA